jgi:acetylornithine deacetylase/succinyl-diaminopimelate desuccinylase-like protein
MSNLDKALAFAQNNHERYLAELKEYVRIPSISTLPVHKADVQRTAEWLAAQMQRMGLQHVAITPTGGHPVVYGEWLEAHGKPTVLIYGHYDVQPVDPLDEWETPPFEPTVRGEEMYARGPADSKGQSHSVLKALEAYLATGGLPLNVKLMLEGEEEMGSQNLPAFISGHRAKLQSDLFLNTDSGIERADVPSLVYALRGMAYFELWVYGPSQDLHSGLFGGSVHNPAQVLCDLIAGMHDANGHITLPGFYDKVRVWSDAERAELAKVPHSDDAWRKLAGVPQLYGEAGFSTAERIGFRPTLEINGMLSGFTAEGMKTIVPARAMAKISTRLVPDQDADAVEAQLNAYVRTHAPATVKWEVRKLTRSAPAIVVERDTAGMRAAVAALEDVFDRKPIFQLMGGSVPVVSMVKEYLNVDVIMLGFAILSDSNIHSPNEHAHLPSYYLGIEAFIRFFDAYASSPPAPSPTR